MATSSTWRKLGLPSGDSLRGQEPEVLVANLMGIVDVCTLLCPKFYVQSEAFKSADFQEASAYSVGLVKRLPGAALPVPRCEDTAFFLSAPLLCERDAKCRIYQNLDLECLPLDL